MRLVSGGACFVLIGKSGQHALDDRAVDAAPVICIDLKTGVFYSDESIRLIFTNLVFAFCLRVRFLKIDMLFLAFFINSVK